MFVALLALSAAHAQGFDWGQDCTDGSGAFSQYVPHGATGSVGLLPDDRRDVFIQLEADEDVDVQLIDKSTGTKLIHWPNGILNGPEPECAWWQSIYFCYSGYNGDQNGNLGKEWILVQGETQREMEMRVYGYQAGDADVTYSYRAMPTCNEVGDGSFAQQIPYYDVVDVGTIPAGKFGVSIDLQANAGRDVDVQIWDGSTPVVQWPDGLLSGPSQESVTYKGVTITYSGYNGIGGDWGHESITIDGELTQDLQMKAFGYQSGFANVDYEWGDGVGDTCGGIGALQCDDGLYCKNWMDGVADAAGECHTETWCYDDSTAHRDCKGLQDFTMRSQYWACEEFECVVKIGLPTVDNCPDEVDCSAEACDIANLVATCPDTRISF